MARYRDPDYLTQAYIRKTELESLDRLLRNLIFELYGQDLDGIQLEDLYSPLFKVIGEHLPQDSIPIFTTNYDMSLETYARDGNIHLETGFEPTPTVREWKPTRFYGIKPIKGKLNLLLFKLHGSLSWLRKDSTIISTGVSMRDPSGYKSVVMYPTQTKEYPDEEPFRTAYNFPKGCLEVSRLVIVIGYSFRDMGIHRILVDAQERNKDLRFMLVCGSKVDHWKKFATQNLRSYHIIANYFDFGSSDPAYLKELRNTLAELNLQDS